MFSKAIDHPLFRSLTRGLLGYSGKMDIGSHRDIDVQIRGRSHTALDFAADELSHISSNLEYFLRPATEDAFSAYEVIKDVVASGELDIEAEGGSLPNIENATDVWQYMKLEEIVVEPNDKYQIRLGFRAPWEIEHDFGIYVTNRRYQYSGISV